MAVFSFHGTQPIVGQKPGTSGLRKKVKVFQQEFYLSNFIQSLFNAIPESEYVGRTILVSGDGRYWNKEAIKIIGELAAANGVARLIVGQNGWVSTPAASTIIREREGGIIAGGILLTASHNPGGPTEDFGVKYNCSNGGPAPESVTDAIFEETQRITEIRSLNLPSYDITTIGVNKLTEHFTVEVINPIEDWMSQMKSLFDFQMIRALIHDPRFSFVYDGMNGIAGPYAKSLFVEELGASPDSLMQCECLEDFGGLHPDPNLTYAAALVERMKVKCPEAADNSTPLFGAAGDGDNDRNMILGRGWFVTPSDSVAIIASYAQKCIPYFRNGLKGVARSMPTSMSLQIVAERLGVPHYEVPTGWKFFGTLMDAGKLSICGEESFGTGSDHIREKDGLWAVLAWLSILAYRNQVNDDSTPFVTVQQINKEFWQEYGRNYYTRYDYESVDSTAANIVLESALKLDTSTIRSCSNFKECTRQYLAEHPIADINSFTYVDPVDGAVSENQGVRVIFEDGSRFVLRLSGTGSSGATIRMYVEKYEKELSKLEMPTDEALEDLVAAALDVSGIEKHTGRNHPSVIT